MVRTGLDVWVREPVADWQWMRLGLVSHPAAVLPDLTSSVDALLAAGYRLTALFGPEHGFRGAAADGARVSDSSDPRTGLPIFSLYGANKGPSAQALAQIDALVFDMQDVGVRFYTFLSTLYYLLRAAGRAAKPVIVLDRPNPITGAILEGGPIEPGSESFVGVVNLPIRHGMTLGEMARLLNEEYSLEADLQVVAMQGWQRQMWFDQTGLPWVPTSPAMPHLSTATLYPGMCLLEGTNLSMGRGASLPFEICGAPWLDGYTLAQEMNALDLPGVRFRPTAFTPVGSTHAGYECSGVQVHVTDREALRPVAMTLHLIAAARRQRPERFTWSLHFDLLTGGGKARSALNGARPVERLVADWELGRAGWLAQREKYLLYP